MGRYEAGLTTGREKVAPGPDNTQALFGVLWACAHVIHTWHQGPSGFSAQLSDPWHLLVMLTALFVLGRPGSPHRLATLSGMQLLAYAIQFPLVANHWTIAAFVNAGVLAAYVFQRRRRAAQPDIPPQPLIQGFATYARTCFLLAYGAAALAKLNTSFLNPEHSCAIETLSAITDWLSLPGPATAGMAAHGVIWTVTGIEIAVVLLLLLPQTRWAGVVVAMVFHLLLAATPVVYVMDFTAYVIALVALFLPGDVGDQFVEEWERFRKRRPRLARLWSVARRPIALASLGLVMTLAVVGPQLLGTQSALVLSWGIFFGYGLVAATVIIAATAGIGPSRLRGGVQGPLARRVLQAMLLSLLLINAASPYLGGKTTSSFTMFSNLRTETGTTNHLFLPRLPIASPQDDLVEIRSSSDDALQQLANKGILTTYHELRRHLSANPDVSLSYVRGGIRHDLDRADEVTDLVQLPYVEAKLFHFRLVDAGQDPACRP